MTKTEGNVLIIEYMGGTREEWITNSKVTGKHTELLWQNCEIESINGCSVGFPNDSTPGGFYTIEQHIHKDWNQLIPVVKKVQKELWEMAVPHPTSIVANALRNAVADLNIDLIWMWTVEGIQVINKYKQANDQ